MWGIHRSPVNSPHIGQWRGALMFSLICALNKPLSKQSWGWRFKTPPRSVWRYCYVWPRIYPMGYAYWWYLLTGLVPVDFVYILQGWSTGYDCPSARGATTKDIHANNSGKSIPRKVQRTISNKDKFVRINPTNLPWEMTTNRNTPIITVMSHVHQGVLITSNSIVCSIACFGLTTN